eukprot:Nitzschia sp. Nitz4//scaffold317_size20466//1311//2144//NITZ4_008660-RA/size20466-augustus-gene-0.18-mRNA-1//-1//CDS//3329547527//999//frame0
MTEALEEYQVDQLREQFHVFDANGSGFIERDELQQALKTLGYENTEQAFLDLMTFVGSSDDRMDFEEFTKWNRELYRQDMKKEFQTIDTAGTGWINKTELLEYSKNMKYNFSLEQVEEFLYQADTNQDDKVDLEEYINAMTAAQSGQAYFVLNAEMYIAKLKKEFENMDVNGDGVVTREDLKAKAKEVHYYLTEDELNSVMAEMDEDHDGKVNLEEFIASAVKRKESTK